MCTLLATAGLRAQPHYTLEQAEEVFLKENLMLLAEQYNIEASRAMVIQAGLWNNPYLAVQVNAYNPEKPKIFDAGAAGQKEVAIEQIIHLGGQRKKEVELTRSNVVLSELQLSELLRHLRLELRLSYFSVFYDMESAAALERQVANVDSLLIAYEIQAARGNVALKDVVRLRSLRLGLNNDLTQLTYNIIEHQARLRLLLSSPGDIVPTPLADEVTRYERSVDLSLGELSEMAESNRPDFLLATQYVNYSSKNVIWQKSLAVPDLAVGAAYDQRGGAFGNQVNLTLGLPLPLWNRNQGNVKLAEARLSQAQQLASLTELELKNEVVAAWQKYQQAGQNYRYISSAANGIEHLNEVHDGVMANFQRRNISLIEFTDYMESYQQSIIQTNSIKKDFTAACEGLNFTTSSTIF